MNLAAFTKCIWFATNIPNIGHTLSVNNLPMEFISSLKMIDSSNMIFDENQRILIIEAPPSRAKDD